MLAILFWTAVGVLLYTNVVFPALVIVRGLVCRRPPRAADFVTDVSVVIIAHNEARVIGEKLENVLSLDYPAQRLEIVVASDGSSDETEAIVRRYADRRVRLLALPRQGKIPALNTAVAAAKGEVLIFTDANSMLNRDAIRALLRPLADPQVGGVAGNQVYTKNKSAGGSASGECVYWDFDRLLKQGESQAGNVTSATGALYAIRRSLARPVPPGVTDDFVSSTNVIALGARLVFEPKAVAVEPVAEKSQSEFRRKVRVMTRGFRSLIVMREFFNPFRYGFYSLQLVSHKLLRRLLIFPLFVLFVTAPMLWNQGWIYQLTTLGQCVCYGCAGCAVLLRDTRLGRFKVFTIPFYFCMVNTAAFMAFVNTVRGQQIEFWEPQRNEPEIPAQLLGVAERKAS